MGLVVAGIGLGIRQWVLVVNLMPRPGWFALGGRAIGAVVGLSVGVTQWLALRQQAARNIWWIPANLQGYTGGLLAGCQVPSVFPFAGPVLFGLEFGVTIGFTVGAVTGIALLFILAQTAAAAQLPE